MTNEEFVRAIISLYHRARYPLYENDTISRGRSHSISSFAEDTFAHFLSGKIQADKIYIDQPISIVGLHSRTYPDITIIHGDIITSFCELKVDLGWQRNSLSDICLKKNALISEIRGKDCKVRNGVTKKDLKYRISKTLTINIVIITDQNINPKVLKKHLESIQHLKPGVEVFVLTSEEHPNTYGIDDAVLNRKIKINEDQFSSLISKLSRENATGDEKKVRNSLE